jgi:hypothetical protein
MLMFSIVASLLVATPDKTVAKARAAFQDAAKLYSRGKYQEAIAKFDQAYEAKPHPSIVFNLGKCYARLNQSGKALEYFRDYLRAVPNGPDINEVSESIIAMERALREQGLQQVYVSTVPSKASVEIDGISYGASPVYVVLAAGKHTFASTAFGFERAVQTVDVNIARSSEISIGLSAQSDVPKREPVAALLPQEKPELEIPAIAEVPHKPRVLTWISAGLAVLAGGTGTVAAVMNLDAQAKSKDEASRNAAGVTVPQLDAQLANTNTIATASFIGAGVAGAAAIVLFFVEGN